MPDARLVIEGQSFPVYYLHLQKIIEELDDTWVESRAMAKAIVSLGIPSITISLLNPTVELLDQQDLDELWAAGDPAIRRNLVEWCPAFVKMLTDAQAQDILDIDDAKIFESIAKNADLIDPDNTELREKRLSRTMAEALLEHIASINRYPEVRQILNEGDTTPLNFRQTFQKCLKSGSRVTEMIPMLQPDDIELLRAVSVESLQYMAIHARRIKNDEARRAFINFLCTHPDPAVRLALARYNLAPQLALKLLLKDSEPDVSHAARKSLNEQSAALEGTEYGTIPRVLLEGLHEDLVRDASLADSPSLTLHDENNAGKCHA